VPQNIGGEKVDCAGGLVEASCDLSLWATIRAPSGRGDKQLSQASQHMQDAPVDDRRRRGPRIEKAEKEDRSP
jgi:hypothetical protein